MPLVAEHAEPPPKVKLPWATHLVGEVRIPLGPLSLGPPPLRRRDCPRGLRADYLRRKPQLDLDCLKHEILTWGLAAPCELGGLGERSASRSSRCPVSINDPIEFYVGRAFPESNMTHTPDIARGGNPSPNYGVVVDVWLDS